MGPGEVAGKVVFCLCGPKGSICCFILSLWGTLMLFLLGGFYYIEAVVLLEDVISGVEAVNETAMPVDYNRLEGVAYYTPESIDEAYRKAAYSCWGAGAIYLIFLLVSGTFIGINIWRKKKQS